jgi:hypothetical protein
MEWQTNWADDYISMNGFFRIHRDLKDPANFWELRDRRSGEWWRFNTLELAKENAERIAAKQPPTDEYGTELLAARKKSLRAVVARLLGRKGA